MELPVPLWLKDKACITELVQAEVSKEPRGDGQRLKRNRHLGRSSPIWPAEQGQTRIQAGMELVVGVVSPKEISPSISSGRDSTCLQSVCCV